MDSDLLSEEESELEEDIGVDDTFFGNSGRTEYDMTILRAISKAGEDIHSFVIDEFLTEIFTAATQLKHMLGDGDGYAFELSEVIRNNALVVARAVHVAPADFIVAAVRAVPIENQPAMLKLIIERLSACLNNIIEESDIRNN